jgi:hypothetical protein
MEVVKNQGALNENDLYETKAGTDHFLWDGRVDQRFEITLLNMFDTGAPSTHRTTMTIMATSIIINPYSVSPCALLKPFASIAAVLMMNENSPKKRISIPPL